MHARCSGVSPLRFFLLTLARTAALAACGVRPAEAGVVVVVAGGGGAFLAPAVFLGDVFVGVTVFAGA